MSFLTVPAAQSRPPFHMVGQATNVFTAEEMDGLVRDNADLVKESQLGDLSSNAKVRRSQTLLLKPDERHRWVYDRVTEMAGEFNRRFFGAEINGIGSVQLARYDEADQGFYDWHTDFGELAPTRKISITVQLSGPDDYEGGEMELALSSDPMTADKTRGAAVAFPSFVLHRVRPVTRGTRWSLVAWITGPCWR